MEPLFSPSLDLLRAQQFTAVDSKCSRFFTIIRPLRASKPTDESHKYHGLPSLFSKKPLPLFSWKCTIQQQDNPKPHLGDMCTMGPICFGLFSGIWFEREGEDEYGKINAPWCCSASDEKLRNSSDLMLFS